MHVFVTLKNKKDPIKTEGARLFTRFVPIKSLWGFSRRSRAANSAVHDRIWCNFELFCDFMIVLLACDNEEDPIKIEGARVTTRKYVDFSGAQGQITPKSVVGSGRNSNSFKFYACDCYLKK